MSNEFSIPVQVPLDSDGFLRRQCPTCEEQFKWLSSDSVGEEPEPVEQYFCPLCGQAAGLEDWFTTDQVEYVQAQALASQEFGVVLREAMDAAFKGIKGVSFKGSRSFSTGNAEPNPLVEPDDMTIVEPPCHPREPVKVPSGSTERVHCLICGALFTA
jgi:hypothetical protein